MDHILLLVHLEECLQLVIIQAGKETKCPICKKKFIEHSELQDKICEMITIKQFANISPGFDVQHRPFSEIEYL